MHFMYQVPFLVKGGKVWKPPTTRRKMAKEDLPIHHGGQYPSSLMERGGLSCPKRSLEGLCNSVREWDDMDQWRDDMIGVNGAARQPC